MIHSDAVVSGVLERVLKRLSWSYLDYKINLKIGTSVVLNAGYGLGVEI